MSNCRSLFRSRWNDGPNWLLPDLWFDDTSGKWRSPYDQDALRAALRKTRLADVDVFTEYERVSDPS
jgi:hypothetical protein